MNPLQVTEWLFRQPPPYSAGLVRNRPAHGTSHAGRLFQASMWRDYAMAWDRPNRPGIVGREWMKQVLKISRSECLRRARINLYLAARLRRPVA